MQKRVAYITGGTKGIGLAIAQALLDNDINVIFTGRTNDSVNQAQNTLDQGRAKGEAAAAGFAADVRDLAAQEKAIAAGTEQFGQAPSIVVANAGVGHFAPIQDLSPEQWQQTIDINLTGVYNTIKASLNGLIEQEGYFFTIASLAGTNFFAGGSAYNASKFGLVGFTQAVMLDLRQQGVKVSTIMPGSVATEFNNRTVSPADKWKIQSEDIAQIVVDLLKMPARTLPSKVEVRPSMPPIK
ncbi:MAG: SDR family oxidoreductase [Bacteroidota bacterium]